MVVGKTHKQGRARDIFLKMLVASLFIISKSWSKFQCPSVEKWLNTVWHISLMNYHAEKRNKENLQVLF